MQSNKSFTLAEMLVVIVIIGILAALGLSQYGQAQERTLSREAQASLRLISAAEKIYRMESTSYYPSVGNQTDIGQINANLKLSLRENNWDYSIAGGANTFTARADRTSGSYSACIYTMDWDDVAPIPNASCP